MEDFSFYSYLIASLSYFLLLLYSIKSLSNNPHTIGYNKNHNIAFHTALVLSFIWSIFATYYLYSGNYVLDKLLPIEVLKNSAWYYYLLTILAGLRYIKPYKILQTPAVYALIFFLIFTFITELTPTFLITINNDTSLVEDNCPTDSLILSHSIR